MEFSFNYSSCIDYVTVLETSMPPKPSLMIITNTKDALHRTSDTVTLMRPLPCHNAPMCKTSDHLVNS